MESLQDVPPMVPESKFRVPLVGLVSGESYNRRKGWFKIGHVSDLMYVTYITFRTSSANY